MSEFVDYQGVIGLTLLLMLLGAIVSIISPEIIKSKVALWRKKRSNTKDAPKGAFEKKARQKAAFMRKAFHRSVK